MNNNIPRFLALVTLATSMALLLVACGGKQKKPEYYDAVETPDLVIPEGLNQPVSHSALVISVDSMPPPSFVMDCSNSAHKGLDLTVATHFEASLCEVFREPVIRHTYVHLAQFLSMKVSFSVMLRK